MKRSKYYQEKNAKKSNALTSGGLAVVLVFLGIFLGGFMIYRTYDYLEHNEFNKRGRVALYRAQCEYSTVKHVSITPDEPSQRNARVHLYKVTNFAPDWRTALSADALVKIEISEVGSSYDKYVSYASQGSSAFNTVASDTP